MSNVGFGWESLLRTDAPSGSALKAGLFTTYDRADERLLVEHLFPLLLKLSREPDGERAERPYFLLELDERLKQLHDKLVVVSSTVREEPSESEESESGTYGWIWRSIRQLTVGKDRKAVQHAKLWLLHWGASGEDGVEHLEIVVSSANLTRSAFKGQLQAAWRACVELHPKGSQARLDGWGILPQFLRSLGESAGDNAHFDFLWRFSGAQSAQRASRLLAACLARILVRRFAEFLGVRQVLQRSRLRVEALFPFPF